MNQIPELNFYYPSKEQLLGQNKIIALVLIAIHRLSYSSSTTYPKSPHL